MLEQQFHQAHLQEPRANALHVVAFWYIGLMYMWTQVEHPLLNEVVMDDT